MEQADGSDKQNLEQQVEKNIEQARATDRVSSFKAL